MFCAKDIVTLTGLNEAEIEKAQEDGRLPAFSPDCVSLEMIVALVLWREIVGFVPLKPEESARVFTLAEIQALPMLYDGEKFFFASIQTVVDGAPILGFFAHAGEDKPMTIVQGDGLSRLAFVAVERPLNTLAWKLYGPKYRERMDDYVPALTAQTASIGRWLKRPENRGVAEALQ